MGSRYHARDGLLYVGATTSAEASLATFISSFTMDFKSDRIDVTAFGDANKAYVQGFSDAQGTYEGFRESAAKQLLTAAQDGNDRKFYFYEDRDSMTAYFYGRAFFDFGMNNSVSDAGKTSGSWAASGTVSTSGIT